MSESNSRPEEKTRTDGTAPVQPPRPAIPVDGFADMFHAAPRPSPYEALESAGPPV